ncbi:c-type cytochrome [Novosphingobium sp. JCM 18896]|nr:c-type cytochrome [Novosphingobium sp. JCM 18896]
MQFVVLGLIGALSACGGEKTPDAGGEGTPVAVATPANAPPAAFAQCRSCHTVEAGRNIIGPSLHGIVGKPAASVAGYTYSNALKASGLTWDEKTLDAWLTSPTKLVPGSKMIFAGQSNPAKRKEIIDYLAKQI